jgi:hypothetical protein
VQLPIGDNLVIAAQRGFAPKFLQMFRHQKKDDGFACGRAVGPDSLVNQLLLPM